MSIESKIPWIFLGVVAVAIVGGLLPYSLSAQQQKVQEPADSTGIAAAEGSHLIVIQQGASKGDVEEPFSPSSISIHAGDKVTWVNKDEVSHTISSLAFNSSQLSPDRDGENSSSFSYTFDQAGVFVYYSKAYPQMAGVVYVDFEETQRELVSSTDPGVTEVRVEMPQDSAYANKYGPFFIPVNARVSVGDRVVWENIDFIPHTATAADGSFDTGVLSPGKSFSIEVKDKGVTSYYCKIHPWMVGTVTVS